MLVLINISIFSSGVSGTTGLPTLYLIASYHKMFICLANYEKPLKVKHHKFDHETIFSNILSNWLNKLWSIHFDQSAGSSHGVKNTLPLHISMGLFTEQCIHIHCEQLVFYNQNLAFSSESKFSL